MISYSLLDYYNYYYGGYYPNPEAADAQEGLNTAAAVDAANDSEAADVSMQNIAADADESEQPHSTDAVTTEVSVIKDVAMFRWSTSTYYLF